MTTTQASPPPTPEEYERRSQKITKMAQTVYEAVHGRHKLDFEVRRDIELSIARFPDELIDKIRDFFGDPLPSDWRERTIPYTVAKMIIEYADAHLITDLMMYLPEIPRNTVIAFSHYRDQYHIDWTSTGKTDQRATALHATAMIVKAVEEDDSLLEDVMVAGTWEVSIIKDQRLVQLVIDRAEDNERINDIILERKATDCDMIIALLDEQVSALSKGLL